MAMVGRPKKEELTFDPEIAKQFIERHFSIEREIKTLQLDKKDLKEEFKDKLDLKLVGNIIRLVKAQLKINNTSEETQKQLEELILDKINMVVSE